MIKQVADKLVSWTELSLPVKDLDRSIRFYQETLGLETIEKGEGWAILRNRQTNQQLCLKQCDSHNHPAISLECSDFEKGMAQLKELGAQEVTSRIKPDFKYGTVKDPDGHEIFVWWERQ